MDKELFEVDTAKLIEFLKAHLTIEIDHSITHEYATYGDGEWDATHITARILFDGQTIAESE